LPAFTTLLYSVLEIKVLFVVNVLIQSSDCRAGIKTA